MNVYAIRNRANGKIYIGQTVKQPPVCRFWEHVTALNANKHRNAHLQAAWNAQGREVFTFDVLGSATSMDELNALESSLVRMFDSTHRAKGYNAVAGGRSRRHSDETRAKIGAANRGKPKPWTPEWREKISAARRGRPSSMRGRRHSPETIEKIKAALRGRPKSPEWRAKISASRMGQASPMRGRKHSPESIAKMRAAGRQKHSIRSH
jgi:group I intron endonuclease